MVELYTSLYDLKRQMNGGRISRVTPLPERVLAVIDPVFVRGLGMLEEDEEKGLRCPVRGCGIYTHSLGRHASWRHRDLGGSAGIRKLLDIPKSAPLDSHALRSKQRANAIARGIGAKVMPSARGSERRRRAATTATLKTMGYRNLKDQCIAQLTDRIIDQRNNIGRVPSARDFQATYGSGLLSACIRTFGTWNNALAQCGFGSRGFRRNTSPEDVLAGLLAWYEAHGSLPSADTAKRAHRAPAIHSPRTIMDAFNTKSWPEAMRQAAALLGIEGGRYGLRKKEKVA